MGEFNAQGITKTTAWAFATLGQLDEMMYRHQHGLGFRDAWPAGREAVRGVGKWKGPVVF